ncbi:hypothetical protein FSP39_005001 [Pinctada imbricata]|uniref:Peptidase S1 domain-containing protein n=1 Tax=Pinctada imbricata TaxID=66713 RepID=A0AA88YHG4_PINIB|nr:hypothetical protein FSP39_005001 [Pinctada imbricata]
MVGALSSLKRFGQGTSWSPIATANQSATPRTRRHKAVDRSSTKRSVRPVTEIPHAWYKRRPITPTQPRQQPRAPFILPALPTKPFMTRYAGIVPLNKFIDILNTERLLLPLYETFKHANYNKGQGTYPNDIALLELDSPVTSTVAKTITIANEGSKFEEQNCVISGWGRLSGGGSVPDDLQAVNMTVLSNSECSSAWRSNILDSQVCVHLRFGYSACNGDSGGPLVCGNTLVGATSWGSSTCSGTYPSVYTRVSSFRDWMRQQAGI